MEQHGAAIERASIYTLIAQHVANKQGLSGRARRAGAIRKVASAHLLACLTEH
jgi:hypothetical protein